jgi:hypothetical protein
MRSRRPGSFREQVNSLRRQFLRDASRVGSNAVALFGKSMSAGQPERLRCSFKGRPIVILLDADARHEAQDMQRQFTEEREWESSVGRVVIAELPTGGKAPADFPREVIVECVEKALHGRMKWSCRNQTRWYYRHLLRSR